VNKYRWILTIALGIATSMTVGNRPIAAQSAESGLLGKDGLIVGIGIGGGWVSTTVQTTQFGETTETKQSNPSVAGDFKFGAGLGERVLLYWFGKAGGYNGPDSFGTGTQTSTVVALSGIGASYWITQRIALNGGVGVSSLTSNRETDFGPGFAVGAEYEFARHWLFDFDVMFGRPDPDDIFGLDRKASTFVAKLTLNWLYY
jgi:hypothetical protein